jgi:hypothetical protein
MRPSPDTHAQLERFDRVERAAHWLNACVVLFLVATGAILYVPSLSAAVGQRLTVENSHVYVGLAVFLPVLIGVAGPWGARFRGDLREMRDLDSDEVAWLRTLGRQGRAAIGKFNRRERDGRGAVRDRHRHPLGELPAGRIPDRGDLHPRRLRDLAQCCRAGPHRLRSRTPRIAEGDGDGARPA